MASTRKWFRVGVEGMTADGRKIERRLLAEAAETYSRPKYGARMFVEHIRGINPEWGFKAMGDVHALRTETVKIDGEDRLALYAELEPTEQMLSWSRDKQKIFTSMELATQLESPDPALRMVDELERERLAAVTALEAAVVAAAAAEAIASITPADVVRVLAQITADAKDEARSELRASVLSIVDRIELDPETLAAAVHYRVEAPTMSGVKVASPRGFEPRCPP